MKTKNRLPGYPFNHTKGKESPEMILRALPLKIASFCAVDEIYVYEPEELGASQAYDAVFPPISGDIYIFDLGQPIIPDGIESNIIEHAYMQAQSDVMQAESMGMYENVKILSDKITDIVPGNNKVVSLLSSIYNYNLIYDNGLKEEQVSELYITGKRNHVIKVRVTCPGDNADHAKPQIYDLLKTIFSIL